MGDRVRSIGATADTGDAPEASRVDHRHDLKVTSDLAFNVQDTLGFSDGFNERLRNFSIAEPFFEPAFWLSSNGPRDFLAFFDAAALTSTVTKIRVNFGGQITKELTARANVHVYPLALTSQEVTTISVSTGTGATITLTVTVQFLQADDTVETTQSVLLPVETESPVGLGAIKDTVSLTQAAYDALATKTRGTLYLIQS